jgi:hypothetical protein
MSVESRSTSREQNHPQPKNNKCVLNGDTDVNTYRLLIGAGNEILKMDVRMCVGNLTLTGSFALVFVPRDKNRSRSLAWRKKAV